MHRVFWLTADLLAEARRKPGFLWLGLFLSFELPLQMGLTDGAVSHSPIFPDGMGMRFTLTINGAGPAIIMLMMVGEIFLPRRMRRELEPLLAAPVSTSELVLACLLPGLALSMVAPLAACPLSVVGFWIASGGRVPSDLVREFGLTALTCMVSTLWLAAATAHALPRCRSQTGILVRALPAFAILLALDAAIVFMRLACPSGWPVFVLLLAALASGAVALWAACRGAGREDLAMRI